MVTDDEGHFVTRLRGTEVRVYAKRGARAVLYEMGIPVLDLDDDPFDVDVGQKVPVNWERNNVPPAWLRTLRAEILNACYNLIGPDDAASRSVTSALAKANPEAVRHVVEARFPNAVTYDMHDLEANSTAVAHGKQIVNGGAFDKETWKA